jgi:hypothetical protein
MNIGKDWDERIEEVCREGIELKRKKEWRRRV